MHKINRRIYSELNGAMTVLYSALCSEYGEWRLITVERGIDTCRGQGLQIQAGIFFNIYAIVYGPSQCICRFAIFPSALVTPFFLLDDHNDVLCSLLREEK